MTDLEIAKNIKLEKIQNIGKKLNISEDDLELYGNYKAKISNEEIKKIEKNKIGKLILVTAINPTPLGEGKTTTSIGLADGLNKIGKKAILALREPSLGPVFGIKGGASLTSSMLNAIVRTVSTMFSIGQAVGSAIRRAVSKNYC